MKSKKKKKSNKKESGQMDKFQEMTFWLMPFLLYPNRRGLYLKREIKRNKSSTYMKSVKRTVKNKFCLFIVRFLFICYQLHIGLHICNLQLLTLLCWWKSVVIPKKENRF